LSKARQKQKKQQSNQRPLSQRPSNQPVQASSTHTKSPSQAKVQARSQRKKVPPPLYKNPWIWGNLIVLAIIIVVGAYIFFQNQNAQSNSGNISGVVTYINLSRHHVTGTVNYPQVPPVGGDHDPVWQNCGIYMSPIRNENAVHSMEHGAVWITYQPSLSSSDVQTLQNLVRGHSYVILSPYPGLPTPVVISAWGVQLKVNSANDPRLAQFISKYEQGPQTPEPGSPCTGGTGSPSS
jgi:Protein of unknown function (DUF3105)